MLHQRRRCDLVRLWNRRGCCSWHPPHLWMRSKSPVASSIGGRFATGASSCRGVRQLRRRRSTRQRAGAVHRSAFRMAFDGLCTMSGIEGAGVDHLAIFRRRTSCRTVFRRARPASSKPAGISPPPALSPECQPIRVSRAGDVRGPNFQESNGCPSIWATVVSRSECGMIGLNLAGPHGRVVLFSRQQYVDR